MSSSCSLRAKATAWSLDHPVFANLGECFDRRRIQVSRWSWPAPTSVYSFGPDRRAHRVRRCGRSRRAARPCSTRFKSLELSLQPVGQSKRAVPRPERNPHCVVLWIEVGEVRAILGADLEREATPDRGWTAIVDSVGRPQGSCHFVKIPHHGSSDAHDQRMWGELLVAAPHAGVTPFRQGRVALPRESDVTRIASLTDHAWLTRGSPDSGSPARPRAVERTIAEMGSSLRMTSVEPGRVTFRCAADSPGNWSVDAPNPAVRLTA